MEKEDAIQIVYEKLVGIDSFPVRIRNMEGVKQTEFLKLTDAINFLISYYENSNCVPKKLALPFVDISNYFFVPNLNYSEEEHQILEDYGITLTELGNKLFTDEK